MPEQQQKRWRSSVEIDTRLKESQELASIKKLACLRWILKACYIPSTYKASIDWERFITLSDHGCEALDALGLTPKTREEKAEVSLAMFVLFFHLDLLINCEKCDFNGILYLLDKEILEGRLKFPQRFGREFYDHFNDTYKGDRTDHLLSEEAWLLMEGMPQGVYQVGNLVLGPLGVINVPHERYIPPGREFLLWHCSDLGCMAAHKVELAPHKISFIKVAVEARGALTKAWGPPSEWHKLASFLGGEVPREPYTYFDVCVLIADCVLGGERSTLLAKALNSTAGSDLRALIKRLPSRTRVAEGRAEKIAESFSPNEQLQLLFLLPNADLIALVDWSVTTGSVRIPLAEIRTTRNRPPSSPQTPGCELSSLGLRSASNQPLLDLWSLLWDAYSTSNRNAELDWMLRNSAGAPTKNILLSYLCHTDPAVAVKDLVLASEPITKVICQKLALDYQDLADARFVDRLLWKVGFDLPRYSEALTLLRRRLEAFSQELVAIGALSTEKDRERIRGVGVNLFVSVEEFLDILLAYNVWLLAANHFSGRTFEFDVLAAKRCVAEVLGKSFRNGEENVRWTVERTNTLGTLIAYLNAAARWIKSLPNAPKEALMRDADDFPHFAESGFRVFPFRHLQLWADCDPRSLEKVADTFCHFTTKIGQSNLAAIRNGLDHHRDAAGFPKIDEMLAFVAHLREAVDTADINRFFPKEFWLEDVRQDRFGRSELRFKDYAGRHHVHFGPSFVQGIPSFSLDEPAIIAPGNLLGLANAELFFTLRQKSDFSDYWTGYPRRRQIPNPARNESAGISPSQEWSTSTSPTRGGSTSPNLQKSAEKVGKKSALKPLTPKLPIRRAARQQKQQLKGTGLKRVPKVQRNKRRDHSN